MSGSAKAADKARRQARLAAALRENLRRRKAQAKARATLTGVSEPALDSAGISAPGRKR